MSNWTLRAQAYFSESPQDLTDKTDEIGVLSVLSVPSQGLSEKCEGVSSVLSVPTHGFSKISSSVEPSQTWLIISGDTTREVTVHPAVNQAAAQRLFPASVIQMIRRKPLAPDDADLRAATAWALVLDERDQDMIRPFACPEGLAWLQVIAMVVLTRDVEAVIRTLSDSEVVTVAHAVADTILPPHPLDRVLAAMRPAMRGKFARAEGKARQARAILRLICTSQKL
ncbi:MAG: hypothetical protein ABIP08_05990 [Lautropia sp.]